MVNSGIDQARLQRRLRFVILSLLNTQGLNLNTYESTFGTNIWDDVPQLTTLIEQKNAHLVGQRLLLSQKGMEQSDHIGPLLISQLVRQLMNDQSMM